MFWKVYSISILYLVKTDLSEHSSYEMVQVFRCAINVVFLSRVRVIFVHYL